MKLGTTPLESLLAIVASVFDAYSAVLFLPESGVRKNTPPRLCSYFSMGEDIDTDALAVSGQNLAGLVASSEAALLTNPQEHELKPGYYKADADVAIRSFMACPVPDGGVLCVDSKRADAFSVARQKLLHLFARHAALLSSGGRQKKAQASEEICYFRALSHLALMREQCRSWPENLQGTLNLLAEYGGFDVAFLATLTDDKTGYKVEDEFPPQTLSTLVARRAVSEGVIGQIFQDGRFVVVDSKVEPPAEGLFREGSDEEILTSYMGIPIMLEGRCCAVLCLGNLEQRNFSRSLERFVCMAAESLQFMLEKLFLNCRLNRLRCRLSHR